MAPENRVLKFPYWKINYAIRDKRIGHGLWSDVYLADPVALECSPSRALTPPTTPTMEKKEDEAFAGGDKATAAMHNNASSTVYAIKKPASRSAHAVLRAEAEVLTHLSNCSTPCKNILEFHGLDSRTGNLVMRGYPTSLEAWTLKELNSLDEESRATKLAASFKNLALGLIGGLKFLKGMGVVHGDLKPGNVLLDKSSSAGSTVITPVIADFSSALITLSTASSQPGASSLGGGTWDFLDPSLVSKPPASISYTTDLYSLAATLLWVVIGGTPFSQAPNMFMVREMVKMGCMLDVLGMKEAARLQKLSELLGIDLKAWFGAVLKKDVEGRVGLETWEDMLKTSLV